MITPERVAMVWWRYIAKRPLQMTVPKPGGVVARMARWAQRVEVWFG